MTAKQTIPPVYYDPQTGEFIHEPATTDFIPNPEILFFTADRYVLTDKKPLTLSWKVQFADTVGIDGRPVALSGTMPFHTMEARTITLVASNKYGVTSEATVAIAIDTNLPVIHYFKADKPFTVKNYPVTLQWKVTGAVNITISEGPGNVNGRVSVVVKPSEDSIYTLTATNFFGYKSIADVALRIFPLPVIEGLHIPASEFNNRDISFAAPVFNLNPEVYSAIEVRQPSFTDLTGFTKLDTLPASIFFRRKAVNSLLFPNTIFRLLIQKQKEFTQIIQSIWKR